MSPDKNQPLSRKEASVFLKEKYGTPGAIAVSTLAKLAVIGGGPEFERFGRRVFYRPQKLDKWQLSRCSGPMTSTSDTGGTDAA